MSRDSGFGRVREPQYLAGTAVHQSARETAMRWHPEVEHWEMSFEPLGVESAPAQRGL